ncbi:MAG: hypothetical protein D4R48_03940 [Nitrosomonadales bacterium]|nr:MAG: hypothetical protein D4R48_03940 [Nitrosomonadales bacterium]
MALIVLVFVVGLAATAYLMRALNANALKIEQDRKTAVALAEAKAALIGWSVQHATKPGTLPCPDTANSGSPQSSGSNCLSSIGRLPGKKIGIGELRDADGECLWYAISPNFRDVISVTSRSSNPLNSTTAGTITLLDHNGAPLPVNPVIAVIISPGKPHGSQDRSGSSATFCGGNNTASNYLDTLNGHDNASGNPVGNNLTFITAAATDSFNDRFVYISAEQLYGPLRKRIANELKGPDEPPTGGLRMYYSSHGVYPWAGDVNGNQSSSSTSGPLAYNDLTITPSALNTWLKNNGWYALTTYRVGSSFRPGTSGYNQTCTTGCVAVRGLNTPAVVAVGGGASAWSTRICEPNSVMTSCPAP